MKNKLLLLIFVLSYIVLIGQPNFPENGPLYDDNTVPRIDISIDPDTLDWLFEHDNLQSDIEFSAQFIFSNGEIADTIYPVGFRLRGNTSRYSDKKSFKVAFNRFTSGGKYYGVEKLNLNGEHNDPSVMRAKTSWDILRKWGIAAPRANHVAVYINSDYYGLYLNTEHIDEEFIKSRFTKNDGNLFKCLYPADLDYLGSDPDEYKLTAGDRRVYEIKINKEADDYSDLAQFIEVLNNTANDDLACELDEVFNVYDYLKVIAADILTANWDGPIYNKNNFYLYNNTTTGKFEYIPYDLDNTYGIDWFGIDWARRGIYNWHQGGSEKRPIYTQIMNNQELRDQYSYYIKKLVQNTIDFDSLNAALVERRNKLLPFITNDYYYTLDYGFTTADFLNSLSTAWGNHVKYGINEYLTIRSSTILTQVEDNQMKPVIKYIKHSKTSNTQAIINAFVESEAGLDVVTEYSFDGSSWQIIGMYDDGMHNDGEANDNTFGGTIDNMPEDGETIYQVYADSDNGLSSLMPCEPNTIGGGQSNHLLFINEFMASNDNTIDDNNGNSSDWIEIYNGDEEVIFLGDKFLTDNLGSPTKWQMPDVSINPGAFLIFWASGNPDDGEFHTNFKLSKDGEEIGIFDENQNSIDEYVYGEQSTDISEGRKNDANPEWIFFEMPTPGSSNSPDAIDESLVVESFLIYPNPASEGIVHINKPMNFKVYNIIGKLIETHNNYDKININGYNKGIYIIVNDSGIRQKLIVN